jgi:putative iron-regulated protein
MTDISYKRVLFKPISSLLVVALLVVACGESEQRGSASTYVNESTNKLQTFSNALLTNSSVLELMVNYLDQVYLDLEKVVQYGEALNQGISRFLSSPEPAALELLRESWISAHSAYEVTTLHSFFLQQLLSFDTSGLQLDLAMDRLNYRLNYWPIFPGYIDYLPGYPDSGIVNDITINLIPEEIERQHGTFDLSEALLGFHPLEFLLWGSSTDQITYRPFTDFMPVNTLSPDQQAEGLLLNQISNNRRRSLLEQLGRILESDLRFELQLWQSNRARLNSIIATLSSGEKLTVLLDSISTMLNEELLVRSLYVLLNRNFTDSIQSPFSNTTQNAVISQLSSIENLLKISNSDEISMELMLAEIYPPFTLSFAQNFDASKECLTLLYTSAQEARASDRLTDSELAIVECINLISNMVNSLMLTNREILVTRSSSPTTEI